MEALLETSHLPKTVKELAGVDKSLSWPLGTGRAVTTLLLTQHTVTTKLNITRHWSNLNHIFLAHCKNSTLSYNLVLAHSQYVYSENKSDHNMATHSHPFPGISCNNCFISVNQLLFYYLMLATIYNLVN